MYITATLGAKTKDKRIIDQMIKLGVKSFRVNLSHMQKKDIEDIIHYVKHKKCGVKIIGDLTGKKIRVASLFNDEYKVSKGENLAFCTEDKYEKSFKIINEMKSKMKLIPLNIKDEIIKDINIESIYIKDGRYRMKVVSRNDNYIICVAESGVYLKGGKSCTITGIDRNKMSIPDRDIKDLRFLIRNGADIVLLSFISCKEDIIEYKKHIDMICKEYDKNIEVWVKVETKEGINNLEEIMDEVDTIVFGRGDMSAEGGLLNIPIYQFNVMAKIHNRKNKVIVATGILNNVSVQGKPSVSELNDIFNMLKQGVYGFMLTSETSVLNNNINAVKYLVNVVKKYEKILINRKRKIENNKKDI